jgi:hypothetical protein
VSSCGSEEEEGRLGTTLFRRRCRVGISHCEGGSVLVGSDEGGGGPAQTGGHRRRRRGHRTLGFFYGGGAEEKFIAHE